MSKTDIQKQYAHTEVELTTSTKQKLDEITADNGALDATQARISALEETVERQGRLIRDLQGMIQYLQFSK